MRNTPFPVYNPIGEEEAAAAAEVVRSGMLSDYIARKGDKFLGGKKVRDLEQRWAEYHHVKHAISFNSATSALIAGIGALGLMPGDEVLVIGYSMCISATAPLFYDAIPIFVDIEEDFFCMDPKRVIERITPRTRAILPVDLFGQSTDMLALCKIAEEHNLKILCDASHVPGCPYNGGYAGTFGDIGVYSLNQHKIIHCGEGGIAVTNDDELALRLQLIRNHAEAVVGELPDVSRRNMIGGNSRMPEVEAAIAVEQLKKLPRLLTQRIDLADYLTEKLSKLEFLTPPKVRTGGGHVYYLYPIKYEERLTGMSREQYIENVRSLGIPLYRFAGGYIKPLYREPIFARKDELKGGYPYSLLPKDHRPDYASEACTVTEDLYNKRMIVTAYTFPPLTREDMNDIVKAFTAAATMR